MDWLEHTIYGDMGETVSITVSYETFKRNIAAYIMMIAAFPIALIVQAVCKQGITWRDADYNFDSVPKSLYSLPIVWDVSNYGFMDDFAAITFIAVITVYALCGFYFNKRWLNQARTGDKRARTYLQIAKDAGEILSDDSDGD